MLKRAMLRVIGVTILAVLTCASPGWAQAPPGNQPSGASALVASPPRPAKTAVGPQHRFLDRTNLILFLGVAAVRTLDFTSTEHFRERGNNEVLLTNNIVDNKPLFAGIEAAGVAASIAVSYWLHRTGHHKLERWVSVIHIGVAAVGDIHNYSLGRSSTGMPGQP